MVNAPTGESRLGPIAQVQALDRDCTTLSRHVLQQLQSFSADAQDLSALMNRIGLAAKLIARRLSRAGLMEDALGFTGAVNVQGESVKHMDIYANEVFISVFQQSGLVCRLASEEEVYKTEPWMIPLAKSFKLPVIHQDQVIELPKDATAIAGNPFCPYSVVTYGGSVLTFQGHPEHKKTYTQALMLRRKDVMEETVFSAGLRSLDDDPDAQLVAKWVVNFLEE